MEGSEGQNHQLFFKEYTCYNFALPNNTTPLVKLKYIASFSSENSSNSASVLPSAIIDNLNKISQLYILQWQLKSKTSLLFIKELNSEDWIQIEINEIPQFITISGGQLFIIIGRELIILSLYKQKQSRKQLMKHNIISVDACLVELVSTSRYEAGISIVYYSEAKGYLKQSYSMELQNQIDSFLTFPKNFNLSFKNKIAKYLHAQVIIPNVLAIVFSHNNQFRIFNLQEMKDYPQSESTLSFGTLKKNEKPVIRWRHHEKFANFDQTLLLLIGVGSNIELFFINMKLKERYAKQLQNQSLSNINNGDIINWESISIMSYISFVIEGNILVDVVISKKGATYYSKNSQNSEIGYFRYIDLRTVFSEIPVLNQEAIIWRNYYQDKQLSKTQSVFNINRYYVPNRYPKQLILQQQDEALQRKALTILNQWRRSYAFRSILAFEEDILIVRASSISIFRQIKEALYKFQYFSEEQHEQIQAYYLNNKQEQDDIEQLWNFNVDDFQQPHFHSALHRPVLQQRKYFIHDEQHLMEEQQNDQIANIFEQLNYIATDNHEALYFSMKIGPFKQQLTSNQLKDKLSYYNLMLNKKIFEMGEQRQRQNCKEYEKNIFAIKVINYFYNLTQQSKDYYDLFGDNLIDLFISRHSDKITTDIDISISILLQLLLQNLFPKAITNYQNSIINTNVNFQGKPFQNYFLNFIVELFTSTYQQLNSNQQGANNLLQQRKLQILKNQFSKIIRLGFLENKSIYFSEFWKNNSIFKILVLSDETELLKKYICQHAIYESSEEILSNYNKLKRYMPSSNISIIERQILVNRIYYKIPFDFMFLTESYGDDDLHHKFAKDIVNEMIDKQYWGKNSLYSNNNIPEIQELFEQLKKTYSSIQIYQKLQDTIKQARFTQPEENLQLYELLLVKFVELFNQIIRYSSTHLSAIESGVQITNYEQSKKIMCRAFNQIKRYFNKYKQLYDQVYERTTQGSQVSMEDQRREEEDLMTSFFLEGKPIALLTDKQSQGIICNNFSLNLIDIAIDVSPTIQKNGQTENTLGSLLYNKYDLVCYWMNQLPKFKTAQRVLYLDLIYKLGKPWIQKYIDMNPQARQEIQRLTQQFQRQNKHYQFYSLLQKAKTGPL